MTWMLGQRLISIWIISFTTISWAQISQRIYCAGKTLRIQNILLEPMWLMMGRSVASCRCIFNQEQLLSLITFIEISSFKWFCLSSISVMKLFRVSLLIEATHSSIFSSRTLWRDIFYWQAAKLQQELKNARCEQSSMELSFQCNLFQNSITIIF